MKPPVVAQIDHDVLLDSRRAIIHTTQGWLAVADIHFGYEVHRAKQGALLPGFGMPQIEQALRELIADHLPRRLILVGDIMDGSGSAEETLKLLESLQPHVAEIICIFGNHDRAVLRKNWPFVETHRESGFLFSHGHHFKMVESTATEADRVHITGHEHPAVQLRDGAGLRLKLPALVREKITGSRERWVLPAFSPWAAGGGYQAAQPFEQWICAPSRVWRYEAPPRAAK